MTSAARSSQPNLYTIKGEKLHREQGLAVRKLAQIMDAHFRLPLGLRIGWDGILGFIPGIGDFATNILSLYIIFQAAILGCPPAIILRMGVNLLIDNAVDAIPIFGNFFDIFWKANLKNVSLLEAYSAAPRQTTMRSRWAIGIGLVLVLFFTLASIVLAVFAIFAMIRILVSLLS